MKTETPLKPAEPGTYSRRHFLNSAGFALLAAGVVSGAAGCSKHKEDFDVGSGDAGLLNIVYVLAQLKLAFYDKVKASPFAGITKDEKLFFQEMDDHEYSYVFTLAKVAGRQDFKDMPFDFSQVNFDDRTSVLNFARVMENTAVAFINSTAYRYKGKDYMEFVGKVVSVVARHATVINNMISFGNFIDNTYVDLSTGMERPLNLADIVSFVNNYSIKKITATSI